MFSYIVGSLMSYIGSLIGSGGTRKVYEYLLDTNYVVKVNEQTHEDSPNYNLDEFKIFQLLQTYGLSKILAPCSLIDQNLLMLKTSPLPPGEYKIPVIFCDRPKNWGIAHNKLYRIDYGWQTQTVNNQLVFKKHFNDINLDKLNPVIDKLIIDPVEETVTIPLTIPVLSRLFQTTQVMKVY